MGTLKTEYASMFLSAIIAVLFADRVYITHRMLSVDEKFTPLVSLVTAAFNEEKNLLTVVPEWIESLSSNPSFVKFGFEIVLVDDGSSDGTWQIIKQLAEEYPDNISKFRIKQNSGAGFAFAFGLIKARGKFVAIYDADGQYSASHLLEASKYLTEPIAICGFRESRNAPFWQVFGSLSTNFLFKLLFGRKIIDPNCAWKIFPRSLLSTSSLLVGRKMVYSGEHSYMIQRAGIRVLNIPVKQMSRVEGKSSTKLFRDGAARVMFFFYLWITQILVKQGVIRDLSRD
jgi:glycosyltransferase involved in cell wall biosynthesis